MGCPQPVRMSARRASALFRPVFLLVRIGRRRRNVYLVRLVKRPFEIAQPAPDVSAEIRKFFVPEQHDDHAKNNKKFR